MNRNRPNMLKLEGVRRIVKSETQGEYHSEALYLASGLGRAN